jgi:DNA-binding XRE family transcriptional regulator
VVKAQVIEACEMLIKNPDLTNTDLAKLVGLSERTLEKERHAKKLKQIRQARRSPRDLTGEGTGKRVDVHRKAKGSDINKRNENSENYEGDQYGGKPPRGR